MTSVPGPDVPDPMTLDPPGSIAVIGGGPLGVEAALYGRFLGYEVTLVEATAIGSAMRDQFHDPLPMLPDRCLSPLAISALRAQQGESFDATLPMTFGQWIDRALVPLTQSDLLSDRVRVPVRVDRIETVAVEGEAEEDSEDAEGEVPPDFLISFGTDGSPGGDPIDRLQVEAVILAVGPSHQIQIDFALPADYFFRIGAASTGQAEQDLQRGRREIVQLYAQLGGRADLDLYRPRRG